MTVIMPLSLFTSSLAACRSTQLVRTCVVPHRVQLASTSDVGRILLLQEYQAWNVVSDLIPIIEQFVSVLEVETENSCG